MSRKLARKQRREAVRTERKQRREKSIARDGLSPRLLTQICEQGAGASWCQSKKARGTAIGQCEVGLCHRWSALRATFVGHHIVKRETTLESHGFVDNGIHNIEYRCRGCEIHAHACAHYLDGNIPFHKRPLAVQLKYASLARMPEWEKHPSSQAYLKGELSRKVYESFPLDAPQLKIAV